MKFSFLEQSIAEAIDKANIEKEINEGTKLRVKLGIDPTSPFLHLGHFVVLKKLQEFQDAGHTVVLIFGDFTAQIGDPSGRNKERLPLTLKETRANAKSYLQQAGRVLNVKKTEVHFNSEWLDKLKLKDLISIGGKFTVQRLLDREDFQNRLNAGTEVYFHEVLYQILQAYDSVAVRADIEIGGQDQKLNLLCGRNLMAMMGLKPQDILILPLLVGTDGKEKMSKSKGNYIAILDSPEEKFGKVMSLPDALLGQYFELLTTAKKEDIPQNPKEAKKFLAYQIILQIDGKEAADDAQRAFESVFEERQLPTQIEKVDIEKESLPATELLVEAKLATSRAEAQRLIEQGAVKIFDNPSATSRKDGGLKVSERNQIIAIKKGMIIQVGKRHFKQIA